VLNTSEEVLDASEVGLFDIFGLKYYKDYKIIIWSDQYGSSFCPYQILLQQNNNNNNSNNKKQRQAYHRNSRDSVQFLSESRPQTTQPKIQNSTA
jgi:hypothetical protein